MSSLWLPLNGDLHNQGISGITATGINISVNTAGKIGSCYSFNGSSSYIELNSALCSNETTEFSYTCWVKFNSTASCCLFSNRTATNSNGVALFVNNSGNILYDIGNERHIKTYSFSTDTWYHLAFTYKKGATKKIYVNGTEIYSVGTSGTMTGAAATKSFIGASQNTSTTVNANYLNGYLNDVRIWNDNCLSAAEVKEIAQGLVLHYKLDGGLFGNPNLVLGSGTAAASTNKWTGHSATGGNTSTFEYNNDTPCVRVTRDDVAQSSWDYLSYDRLLQSQIKTNTTYTVTFDCKPDVDGSISFAGFVYGNATNYLTASTTNVQSNCYANKWNHMVYKCITKSSFDGLTIGGQVVYFYRSASLRAVNVSVLFKNIKVEEGDAETPWCPADSELDIDRTIVEDSSGYNHNGAITGTLTSSSDTPHYSVATTSTAAATITNTTSSIPIALTTHRQYTMCAWLKTNATNNRWIYSIGTGTGTTRGLWVTTNGSKPHFAYSGSGAFTGTITVNDNVWHHIAFTVDDTTSKCYVDGTLCGSSTSTRTDVAGGNNIAIIFNGSDSLSDFRIYCTPLLDTDIKQLYNVGMKIDKLGNMHPFELEENIGMVPNVKFVNNSANSVTYDATTDTYTIVSKADTSSWGYGVRLADDPSLWVPYGATYRWTAEVWTPIALSINTDYNNTTGSTDTNWAGNDNDATGTRLAAGASIPANTWTRVYRGASNTNNGNTNHLPIRDYSSLGLVTNGQSDPVTWKVRHLQWYLIDNTFKPQLKRTGVFKSSHFTETEEDLNKPAQLNKKMFSTNATQFIER